MCALKHLPCLSEPRSLLNFRLHPLVRKLRLYLTEWPGRYSSMRGMCTSGDGYTSDCVTCPKDSYANRAGCGGCQATGLPGRGTCQLRRAAPSPPPIHHSLRSHALSAPYLLSCTEFSARKHFTNALSAALPTCAFMLRPFPCVHHPNLADLNTPPPCRVLGRQDMEYNHKRLRVVSAKASAHTRRHAGLPPSLRAPGILLCLAGPVHWCCTTGSQRPPRNCDESSQLLIHIGLTAITVVVGARHQFCHPKLYQPIWCRPSKSV
jgi:hypothetical protein